VAWSVWPGFSCASFAAALQFAVQPGAGEGPPALGGGDGDAQRAGRLGGGQAGEEAELDQAGLVRLLGGQAGQGGVEVEQVLGGLGDAVELLQRHAPPPPAVLDGLLAAGVVDEDVPHGLGTGGVEVVAALPGALDIPADEAEVGIVDEGGGLERLARRLVGQALGGELPQLVVDERQELAGGAGVAMREGVQDLRDLVHGRSQKPDPP